MEQFSPSVVRQAVRNVQISEQTTFSFRVSWELQDPNVRQYRISYVTRQGDRAEEVVSVVALGLIFILPSLSSPLLFTLSILLPYVAQFLLDPTLIETFRADMFIHLVLFAFQQHCCVSR